MSDVKVGDIIEKGAEEIPAEVLGFQDRNGRSSERVSSGWLPEACVGYICEGHTDDDMLYSAPLTVTKVREPVEPRPRHFPPLDGPPPGLRKVRDDETGEVFVQWPNGFWGDEQLGWLELREDRSLTEVLDNTTEANG